MQTDDALHQFSASLLRIPTQTITTVPRDENLRAVESTEEEEKEKESVVQAQGPPRQRGREKTKAVDYGGNWILGNNKGVYLRATNDSFVANDETEDEVEATDPETYTFPFANEKRLEGEEEQEEEDGDQDHEDEIKQSSGGHVGRRDASDSESGGDSDNEFDEARLQKEKAAHDRVNDELAWRFFAGSIGRTRTEEILECVGCYQADLVGCSVRLRSSIAHVVRCLLLPIEGRRKGRFCCVARTRRRSSSRTSARLRSTTCSLSTRSKSTTSARPRYVSVKCPL